MIKNTSSVGRCDIRKSLRSSCRAVRCLTLLALVVSCASIAQAAVFNYSDQVGTTVKFTNISENTHSDPLPLFGAPTPAGDTLDFSPVNFFASSQFATPPFDITDGLLKFRATSLSGAIETIKFAEGGALSVVGPNATNATFVDVSAIGFLDILAVDGLPINKISVPIELTFTFGVNGNGTWRRISEGLVNAQRWTGSQLIDVSQELTDRGITYVNGATLIEVVLDNSLYAQSEAAGGTLINKNDFFTVTVNVPEPASCLLAMFAAMAGVMVSRRSR